ncbi:MAG: UDP-N-acetylglucosamine 4,6-dehydratase [Spirochaetales bacterium]|nr:UDP-N-acetylglucosamine 4,6-dehydratase [Spirochaetales bacterium]
MQIDIDPALTLIGRTSSLLDEDVLNNAEILKREAAKSRFLVIGGAGSIGQAVVKEIFGRNPKTLHVVDISENNLVELVRDIRSSMGYIDGDFRTFALDCGSRSFEAFFKNEGAYDYVFNLSALKHVRSEKDPYTLMRMVNVNILNTIKTMRMAAESGACKYFCVSTDKAANPVNMMGASKRIMEMFLMRDGEQLPISTARFANVAFSDGSLLHGFNQRLLKDQPLAAPSDVRRYFVTAGEAGQLCLLSGILGENRDIFFPKLSSALNLVTFSSIAEKYLLQRGYEPVICGTEDEARLRVHELKSRNQWPCYFFKSDTTGEKDFEEFFTENEDIDLQRFNSLGVVKNSLTYNPQILQNFLESIQNMKDDGLWSRNDLIRLFNSIIPNFNHKETGKFLDGRM